ncbi:MAG: SAM-dependent methyltransferase [Gemmatimonadetes bacterium]|nr:SAM-dependent methyltransferase [Gemmatimonadota bacterium]
MKPTIRSPLVRFYLWQGQWWVRLVRAVDGAHAGVWLGLLTREQLEAVDDLYYHDSSTYNGEPHNLRGLTEWEEEAMGGFFGGRTRLAVLGAGGGREVLALERRGHQVDGFECNPALVEFAAGFLPRHGAAGTVRLLPRDATPQAGGYDGVIMGWGSYTLIAGRERRIHLLRRLRALVPQGAPLLLSFFSRPHVLLRLKVQYRVARVIRRLLRREPPELGDDLVPVFVHRFDHAEIEAELREAGFRLARYEPEGRRQHDAGWAVGIAEPLPPAG